MHIFVITQPNTNYYLMTLISKLRRCKEQIGHFHSRGQHLCKFIGTKENVYIGKDFSVPDIYARCWLYSAVDKNFL